jgi:hypothetical protein
MAIRCATPLDVRTASPNGSVIERTTAAASHNALKRVRKPGQISLKLIADNIELARGISSNALVALEDCDPERSEIDPDAFFCSTET